MVETMMTLQDVIKAIHEAELSRDIMHELTPANKELLHKKGGGTFEAVLTGNGNEKCLIPEVGTLQYFFRGQNEEFIPCVPSIYRRETSDAQIFVERMRLIVFFRLLATHPVVQHFFKRHNFKVSEEGLAQHYGLKTSMLDLTSSLDIALFFALCWRENDTDVYHYYNDGKSHTAILYVFEPILDNEPTPSSKNENYMNHNITPIGLQAFPRPGIQQGYALHIDKRKSVKCLKYSFSFTCEDSKYYYDKFESGNTIMKIDDPLVSKAKEITMQYVFSFDVFNETFEKFRPKGYSKTKLKKTLPQGIILKRKVDDVVFNKEEQEQIIKDWNECTGAKMAEIIRRKPWFEHDGIGSEDGRITGMRNSQDYRSLKRISRWQMMKYIANPNNPSGAEWVNYTNEPRPTEVPTDDNGEWIKIPASMENLFGKKFLMEDDWKISVDE